MNIVVVVFENPEPENGFMEPICWGGEWIPHSSFSDQLKYDWIDRDGQQDKHLETIHFPGNVWANKMSV